MSRLSEILPRRLDLPLLLSALALTGGGLAMVYSTTLGTARSPLFVRQLLFAFAGVVFATILVAIDYRRLLQASPGLVAASLLVLLWLPVFGTRIAGAKSWLKLGAGLHVQPSELAKIPVALLIALILEKDDRPYLSGRTIGLLCAAVGLPVVLILAQPDLGVALTFGPFLAAALFFGGLRARWWAVLLVAGALATGGSWFLLKEYQRDRIRTFLDPDLAARGAGYQVRQAKIAIGSGGPLGKGFTKGSQSRLGFLPVRHTDFIFAALAEEWGFAGVAATLSLYGLLLSRGLAIARDARDRGGAMLALLLSTDLVVQALVNAAMNAGVLPTTGITLPLVSYGGSSMLASWGMIGLCLSVAYRRYVNV